MPNYLPILMYHQILPKSNPHFSKHIAVDPDHFRQQISYLLDMGFTIKTVKEYFSHHDPFSQSKVAILSFDDVSSSFMEHGLPIMNELKVKGSLFPIQNMTFNEKVFNLSPDGISPLSESDLKNLHQQGFELGSHGQSHQNFRKIPYSQVRDELKLSKAWLEKITESEVETVCYPIGGIDRDILKLAQELGFKNGLSTLKGLLQFESDRMCLRRVDIKNHVVGKKLKFAVSPFYGFRRFITRPFRSKYRVDGRHPDFLNKA